jgi:hypothetical protein
MEGADLAVVLAAAPHEINLLACVRDGFPNFRGLGVAADGSAHLVSAEQYARSRKRAFGSPRYRAHLRQV